MECVSWNVEDVFQHQQKYLGIRVLVCDSLNDFLKDTISSETFNWDLVGQDRLAVVDFFQAYAKKTSLRSCFRNSFSSFLLTGSLVPKP